MDQARVLEIVQRYNNDPSQLLAILQDIQGELRYLPQEHLRLVARQLEIPVSQIYHTATFFRAFSLTPKGRHVCTVCMGTACHVRGAKMVLEELERDLEVKAGGTTANGEYTLETVNCVGACALGPVVMVDEAYHGNMSSAAVRKMLKQQAAKAKAAKGDGAGNGRPSVTAPPEAAPPTSRKKRIFLANQDDLEKHRHHLAAGLEANKACIAVCGGPGCLLLGSEGVAEAFKAQLDEKGLGSKRGVTLKLTGCHGFCEKGPLVLIHPEGTLYTSVKVKDVDEIIEKTIQENEIIERLLYKDPETKAPISKEEDIPFYKRQERTVSGMNRFIDPMSIDDYIAAGGYAALAKVLNTMTPDQVIAEVSKAGLRGRGGGGFASARKWKTCREAHGDTRIVICNADEGDPGAYMDRSLLEGNPHLVLEGMIIGAYAIAYGVSPVQGFIYVRNEYPRAVKHFRKAVEDAREYGLLGAGILGKTGFDFDIRISKGGGAFVCGESSALMASLEGKPGEPRAKYVHTVHRGAWEKPSNLNNVETWANVPWIINKGADWYRSRGTEGSKGTKIFSVVGKINNTGLVEVPMGLTLRQIVDDIGGGIRGGKKVKAIQTGGPSGGCIPERLFDTPVDFDRLTELGSMMGSGGMIVTDEDTCMVDFARYFVSFLAEESCGKCTPCREGIRQMLGILTRICEGRGRPGDVAWLVEIGNAVIDSSLCQLGGSAPNPVLSTIRYFQDEYDAHIFHKKCPAGVCRELVTYSIDQDKCTGCAACAGVCPQCGIVGTKKKPHSIDTVKCIKCGICYETCKFDAVLRA